MKFLKRNLGLVVSLLVLVCIALLIGYWVHSAQTAEFHPRTDNTLRRWISTDPDYLNPIIRTDVYASWVLDYVNHYLIEWNMEKNENFPRLCKEWIISEDGLDYTFPLRTDVKWQDGETFDADDVTYSFKIAMDPTIPVGYARSGYMDMDIRDVIPADNQDGQIAATEYVQLSLNDLPQISGEAILDGRFKAAAAMVAESTRGVLRAARLGDRLYLSAPVFLKLDTVFFIAAAPGEPESYGPSAKVAKWDALFLADDGNTQPARTGWLAIPRERVQSATYAAGASDVECIVDLKELFANVIPATCSIAVAIVDDVQLEKLDQFTVRFHFPRKVYNNLDNAGYIRLVAQHQYDDGTPFMTHAKRDEPIGTGPYRFEKWTRNSVIAVERWDGYWGASKPKIKRVEFKITNDLVVAYQAFKKGDIDALEIGTWTYMRKAVGPEYDAHFNKVSFERPGFGYVGWNAQRSFFSDYRCRQAMSHLFDLENICKYVLLDLYRPVTGPFFFKEPACDSTLQPYPYDIEAASRLLTEAGWIDRDGDGVREKDINNDGVISREPINGDPNLRERFVFDILIVGGPDAPNHWVMLSLVQNGPKVGIEVRPRMVEWALFLDWTRKSNFDASYSGWVFGFEADPYDLYHSSQIADGFNRIGFSNPEMDRMLERARQELDKEKRNALFREIHRRLYQLQPYTFTISNSNQWALNKRVLGVRTYDLGFEYNEWYLETHEDGR